MSDKKDDLFNNLLQTVFTEADKINTTLNTLHAKFISQGSTVPAKITDSLKSLEHAVEIIVRNTDIKTNQISDHVFTDFNQEQAIDQLKKIGLLSRRLEREIREHYQT